MKHIELAIIGGGIAGVSCAVYAQRAGLDIVLFEGSAIGGQLLLMEAIDNYVGLHLGTKGHILAEQLAKTLTELNIALLSSRVENLDFRTDHVMITTEEFAYQAKGVVIATGASPKRLNAPGEERLTGKGVSYCAICDGFFFRQKEVAVIGGGNTAIEEALYLSDICKHVYIIHRRDTLRAMPYLQNAVVAKKNITIIYDSNVQSFQGADVLESVVVFNTKTNKTVPLAVHGAFIAIGVQPNTSLIQSQLSIDEYGFIKTDDHLTTSCPFVWACGDCRQRPLRQLITAASEGAIAAISAYRHFKGHYISI